METPQEPKPTIRIKAEAVRVGDKIFLPGKGFRKIRDIQPTADGGQDLFMFYWMQGKDRECVVRYRPEDPVEVERASLGQDGVLSAELHPVVLCPSPKCGGALFYEEIESQMTLRCISSECELAGKKFYPPTVILREIRE